MTVKELKNILNEYPEDATVMYYHNKYGRVDIDDVEYKEEVLLSELLFKSLTLKASFEED